MRSIIIANWKMNLGYRDSMKLARDFADVIGSDGVNGKDVIVCPSASSFLLISEVLKEAGVKMGAQDLFWENEGEYTGCESPKFLHEAGCRYAIIGHSERRRHLGEANEQIHKKIKAALEVGITPILCVGETAEERRNHRTDHVILSQVISALKGIDLIPSEQIIIAYEPVWVIGSGQAIEPHEAEHAFRIIHQAIIDLWPLTIRQNNVRIIYGGSVDGSNAKDFTNLDHFNGFLVGGASLKAEEFLAIVNLI
ncbi:MAG: triose-phosphate isomerase [Candidatus Buchananbacteria bacterium]|jgi:triosephosphate isomerase